MVQKRLRKKRWSSKSVPRARNWAMQKIHLDRGIFRQTYVYYCLISVFSIISNLWLAHLLEHKRMCLQKNVRVVKHRVTRVQQSIRVKVEDWRGLWDERRNVVKIARTGPVNSSAIVNTLWKSRFYACLQHHLASTKQNCSCAWECKEEGKDKDA